MKSVFNVIIYISAYPCLSKLDSSLYAESMAWSVSPIHNSLFNQNLLTTAKNQSLVHELKNKDRNTLSLTSRSYSMKVQRYIQVETMVALCLRYGGKYKIYIKL